MNNPVFADDENIPLVQDKEDYDYYNTPGTRRVDDKTSFKEHDTTEPTSTLRLRQKVKRDKIVSLYRYLDVTVDPGLAELDQFMIKKKIQKQVILNCFFLMVINIGSPLLIKELVSF